MFNFFSHSISLLLTLSPVTAMQAPAKDACGDARKVRAPAGLQQEDIEAAGVLLALLDSTPPVEEEYRQPPPRARMIIQQGPYRGWECLLDIDLPAGGGWEPLIHFTPAPRQKPDNPHE